MQEVWRCEGNNVFLYLNYVKRFKGEDYEIKSDRIKRTTVSGFNIRPIFGQ